MYGTFAGRQGVTPGAVVGAGPGGPGAVGHDVAGMAGEGDVLTHREVLSDAQTVGRDARVTAADHCQ